MTRVENGGKTIADITSFYQMLTMTNEPS